MEYTQNRQGFQGRSEDWSRVGKSVGEKSTKKPSQNKIQGQDQAGKEPKRGKGIRDTVLTLDHEGSDLDWGQKGRRYLFVIFWRGG